MKTVLILQLVINIFCICYYWTSHNTQQTELKRVKEELRRMSLTPDLIMEIYYIDPAITSVEVEMYVLKLTKDASGSLFPQDKFITGFSYQRIGGSE